MSYHPLGMLVTNLTKAFKQSYKFAHSTLLPHAIMELKYILERTHQIIGLVSYNRAVYIVYILENIVHI